MIVGMVWHFSCSLSAFLMQTGSTQICECWKRTLDIWGRTGATLFLFLHVTPCINYTTFSPKIAGTSDQKTLIDDYRLYRVIFARYRSGFPPFFLFLFNWWLNFTSTRLQIQIAFLIINSLLNSVMTCILALVAPSLIPIFTPSREDIDLIPNEGRE